MIFSAIAQAASFVVSYLAASAGVTTLTAISWGYKAGVLAAQLAGAAALSAVSRALAPSVNIPTQEIQAVLDQSDAPRRVYVGRFLAGGIRALFDVKGGALHQLVVVNHGQIDAFEEFWIDGEPAALDGAEVASGPKAGFVAVTTRNGSGQGGNYPVLADRFPYWTANHRLQNQATFFVRSRAPGAEDFMKVFPKASQTLFQYVIRGSRVYDPRSGATVWSDNAALVIAHYLTHPDGYRLARSEVNWDSVAAMADWCDLPIPQRAGGTAPNMRLWGYWTMDEEPSQVLARMALSSGIRAYETQDGRIGLIGGPFGTPACTITTKDIAEIQNREAINEREGYNTLRPMILAPAAKYEIAEIDTWRDATRLAQEGEIAQEMRMEMCPDTSQGRRRTKMQMHDDNRAEIEIVTNTVGLKARYPAAHGQRHTILLDYRPEDGSGRVIAGEFEVKDHEFDPIEMRCRIVLARIDRASEAWNPATEEGDPPAAATGAAYDPPPDIEAVLTQDVRRPNDSAVLAFLKVSAVPVPDRDDLSLQARYRIVGDSAWIDMSVSGFTAESSVVRDGQQYEAQARFKGVFAGLDEWEDLGPVTIMVDATPPGDPSQLIPSNGPGYVHLSWRNPNGPFARVRIYRGSSSNPETAALIGSTGGASGQLSEYQDDTISPATQYWYWVAAANVSGVESARIGPATITTPA